MFIYIRRLKFKILNIISSAQRKCSLTSCKDKMENPLNLKLSSRLCPLVRPSHYKLELIPDLSAGVFQGTVSIDIDVIEEKNYFQLHTKFLNINRVNVLREEEVLSISKLLEVKELEQLLVTFDNNLSAGKYQINIEYNGDLTRNIVGFYLSRLQDDR